MQNTIQRPSGPRTRPSRRRSVWRNLWLAFQVLALALICAAVGVTAFALYSVAQRLPSIQELGVAAASTNIYSADGVRLARVYRENRDYVPIDELPESIQQATVAIEDDRFYSHPGIDFRGIGRALVANLRGGSLGQGGSTITQQLARNAYGLGRQKTIARKLQEAVVALRLERRYTKREILEGYLNQIYYGSRAYGIQAASLEYFGVPASRLTLPQAALLAGLAQRPTVYNPYRNPEAARNRRDVVLNRMAELGYITPEEAERAKSEPIRLSRKTERMGSDWKAPYFVDYVLRELSLRYGDETVYKGGLTVQTTLLYSMQKAAESAVRNGMARAASRGLVQPQTEVALTCVDPHNGYVRAMVGGRDWNKSQFNRAINNKRQPGSTFKLFVYTAALSEGWSQYRTVQDSPKSWPLGGGRRWSPKNYDGRWRGRISLRNAVAWSVNMAAIRTADAIGMPRIIALARRLGLKGDLKPHLATAIGAGGASTLEMAGAYGAFATQGRFVAPSPIVTVKDRDGNILEQQERFAVQVVDSGVAREMGEMLRAVVTSGTGRAASVIPDAHGKTGTTNDDRDAWFVGYTPQLCAAVWIGNDDYKPMRHAYGGMACAPIWVEFMRQALAVNPRNRPDYTNTLPYGAPEKNDTQSAEVDADGNIRLRICTSSGMIATNRCPSWRTRRFKPGEAPTQVCTQHSGEALSPVPTAPAAPAEPRESGPPPSGPETALPPAPEADAAGNAPEETPQRRARGDAGTSMVTVTLCADSGLAAGPNCPRTITRRVPESAVPRSLCTLHR
jgi:penicillin-binding protein 1A